MSDPRTESPEIDPDREVEDAANLLLMVAPTMMKQAEERAAKMAVIPPVITSPHPNMDLLDTLAALAAQKSPIHRKKIAWNDDMSMNARDGRDDSERPPMRRPRSNSEPWSADTWASTLSMAKTDTKYESGVMLPYMLEKYADIYNKNGRIGIYTREERDQIIKRFHEKRKRRVWSKQIRYHCRKNLADRRVRVKGRFVKLAPGQTEEDLLEQEYGASTTAASTSGVRRKGELAASLADGNDAHTDGSSDGSLSSGSSAKRVKRSKGNGPSDLPPKPPRATSRPAGRKQSFDETEEGTRHGTPTGPSEGQIVDMDDVPYKRMRRHSVAY